MLDLDTRDMSTPAFDWPYFEALLRERGVVIDRPRGSAHPRYPDMIYPIDYGELPGTIGGDGDPVDVFVGSVSTGLDGALWSHDSVKNDREIKLLWNCSADEIATVRAFLTAHGLAVTLVTPTGRYAMHRVVRDIPRPTPDVIDLLRQVPSSALGSSNALGPEIAMDAGIRPVTPNARMVGPAFTCKPDGPDLLIPFYATTLVGGGDILIVDGGGFSGAALFGFGMTLTATKSGAAGIIVDGLVTDVARLRDQALPIFARGIHPGINPFDRPGSINGPVRCGGQDVMPGDIIHADDDGVLVIPRDRIPDALAAAQAFLDSLTGIRAGVAEGKSFFAILGLDEKVRALGIDEA